RVGGFFQGFGIEKKLFLIFCHIIAFHKKPPAATPKIYINYYLHLILFYIFQHFPLKNIKKASLAQSAELAFFIPQARLYFPMV
ncbi:MAG: hypothetical protein ACOY4Q_09445, partial [Bacillota bacterium]